MSCSPFENPCERAARLESSGANAAIATLFTTPRSTLRRSHGPVMFRSPSNNGGWRLRGGRCFDYHRTMKDGPAIAPIAALAGDPARANMLAALAGGKALTASELANEAGVTAQTA